MKKLNSTEVLISKALINSYISHHNFVLVNNVLREQDDLKGNIKKIFNISSKILLYLYKTML